MMADLGTESSEVPERPKTLPVYISKGFAGDLYLVQHPLKPATDSETSPVYKSVYMKPDYGKLQLTTGLNENSKNYDKLKSDNLVGKGNHLGSREDATKISNVTYEGQQLLKPKHGGNYVVAYIKDNAVHLCPLKGIIPVKPTCQYLNKKEMKAGGSGGDADTETEDEEEATKVTVKFLRGSKDKGGIDRPKSLGAQVREEEETPWVPMRYHRYKPQHRHLVETPHVTTESVVTPFTTKEYFDRLFPKYVEPVYDSANEKQEVQGKISITQLKQMSLGDQIKTLLSQANVVKYQDVHDFMRTKLKVTLEDSELIRHLHTCAYVVQGCWVVRSEHLYPPNCVTPKGVTSEIMIQARDFVLQKFTISRLLQRKILSNSLKLSIEVVTDILRPIARAVPKQGYEFILTKDDSFTTKFPDVIMRQSQVWERKGLEQKNRKMSTGDSGKTQRRRSRGTSISSDNESGAEPDRGRRRHNSTRSEASHTPRNGSH